MDSRQGMTTANDTLCTPSLLLNLQQFDLDQHHSQGESLQAQSRSSQRTHAVLWLLSIGKSSQVRVYFRILQPEGECLKVLDKEGKWLKVFHKYRCDLQGGQTMAEGGKCPTLPSKEALQVHFFLFSSTAFPYPYLGCYLCISSCSYQELSDIKTIAKAGTRQRGSSFLVQNTWQKIQVYMNFQLCTLYIYIHVSH